MMLKMAEVCVKGVTPLATVDSRKVALWLAEGDDGIRQS